MLEERLHHYFEKNKTKQNKTKKQKNKTMLPSLVVTKHLTCKQSKLWCAVTLKMSRQDFLCGPVVDNLPANGGDMGLIPGMGRSHMLRNNKVHALQLLSLCSGICAQEPVLRSLCSATREATAVRNLSTAARETRNSQHIQKKKKS